MRTMVDAAATADPPTGALRKPRAARLRTLLPHVFELVRPHLPLLLLGLLLISVNRVAGLVLPASTQFLIDDIIGRARHDLLLPLVGAVLSATTLQAVTSFALTQTLSRAAQRLIYDTRRRVQEHVGRLPVSYFDEHRSGELATRVMNDAEGLRNLMGTGLIDFAGGLLSGALALGLMLRLSPAMTIVIVAALLTFCGVLLLALARLRPIFRERGQIYAEVSGRLQESLAGTRVVKGYHAEAREAQAFSGGALRLLDNVLRTLTSTSIMALASTVLLGLVGAGVMYAGARLIFSGALTVGGLFTFTVLVGFLISPILGVVSIGTQLSEALAGVERLRELLGERPEDEDPLRTLALPALSGDLVFDDVRFAYAADKPVLRGVSFHAPAGSVTALVGPSGAGKSTLIGLVAAFHAPSAGAVRVDGVDLSHVRLDSYRPHLGVVLQESCLFDGPIRENVAFAPPTAGEEDVLRACRMARVDEFAERFEKGYDTVVGERGVKLSGGQRQRVSIARAILADPRILILDEATSSLDSESERLIQQALAYLMQGRTTFVIAHRLSTIRRADQILVVEDGRIVERGRHEELLALRGRYHAMYTLQYDLENNLFLAPGEAPVAEEEIVAAAGRTTAAPGLLQAATGTGLVP